MMRRSFLSMTAALGLTGAAPAAGPPGLEGEWSGVLGGPGGLRLRLVIAQGGEARLFSLDQGGEAIPARWRAAGGRVTVEAADVRGVFEGRLEDGALVGRWRQGAAMPLTLRRGPPPPPEPPQALTADGLAALRARAGAPALGAAAARRGGGALILTDGTRARRGAAVTDDDLWHWGSVTKSMTATLIARAVEAGALSWTDTVGSVLGASAHTIEPQLQGATVLHLLSHRSGMIANIGGLAALRFAATPADAMADRLAYVRLALAARPEAAFETAEHYSNAGYVVAAAMLEARLGAPWEALIQDRLFSPLGVTGAGFGAPDPARGPLGHAEGLSGLRARRPGPGDLADNVPALGPAGRVHMSLGAMLAYLAGHRDRAPILSAAGWDRLHTPPFGGEYALGLARRPDGALWHDGSNTLWYAEVSVDPARGAAAAAACNSGAFAAVRQPVAAALAGAAAAV